MNKLDLKNIAENLIDTFFEAGKITEEISKKGTKVTIKSDYSPVTDADIAVNKLLTNKIKQLTPNVTIISEETVDLKIKNKDKNFWLIDPIDGTRDYIKGRDEYTLNAALIIDLEPVLGIIFAPKKNRLFFSYGKNFSFEINNGKRISLNCKKNYKEEIIGLENSGVTPNEILNIYNKYKVSKMIKMSSSLKFCVLAAGEADIYAATARAFEWDIAAGHAILEHAGGCITTHDEKKFFYGKEGHKNLPIVAKRALDLEN